MDFHLVVFAMHRYGIIWTCLLLICQGRLTRRTAVQFKDGDVLSGVVEIYIDGLRAFIQGGSEDWELGSVLCRQMGLGPPTYTTYDSVHSTINDNDLFFDSAQIICYGWEKSLSECDMEDVVVWKGVTLAFNIKCLPANAKDFQVALVGKYDSDGILLIFVNGQWGSVCSNDYGDGDSNTDNVICRQLGYAQSSTPYFTYDLKVFSGPVLDKLKCQGSEDNIKDCSYVILEKQDCQTVNEFHEISCNHFYSTESPPKTGNRPISKHMYWFAAFLIPIVYLMVSKCSKLSRRQEDEIVNMTATETEVVLHLRPVSTELRSPPLGHGYPSRSGYPTSSSPEYHSEPAPSYSEEFGPGYVPAPGSSYPLMCSNQPNAASSPNRDSRHAPPTPPPDPELPTYEEALVGGEFV